MAGKHILHVVVDMPGSRGLVPWLRAFRGQGVDIKHSKDPFKGGENLKLWVNDDG